MRHLSCLDRRLHLLLLVRAGRLRNLLRIMNMQVISLHHDLGHKNTESENRGVIFAVTTMMIISLLGISHIDLITEHADNLQMKDSMAVEIELSPTNGHTGERAAAVGLHHTAAEVTATAILTTVTTTSEVSPPSTKGKQIHS